MFIGHMCVDILQSIAVLSVTFCLIGLAGLIGNLLVIGVTSSTHPPLPADLPTHSTPCFLLLGIQDQLGSLIVPSADAQTVSALKLLQSGTLSLHLSVLVPVLTPSDQQIKINMFSFSRTLTTNLLSVPLVRASFGARSFSVAAPKLELSPPELRTCTSPDTFRRHLKTHCCQQAFKPTPCIFSCSSDSAFADHCAYLQIICIYLLTYII